MDLRSADPSASRKVYNGKDKTFFFFNFEQFRQSTVTANGLATAPLPAYARGDFSAALSLGGKGSLTRFPCRTRFTIRPPV